MKHFLTSIVAALKSKQREAARETSDPTRRGLGVLMVALIAALFGMAPTAQAQERGDRGRERGNDEGERGRGQDRGGDQPPPGAGQGHDVDAAPETSPESEKEDRD